MPDKKHSTVSQDKASDVTISPNSPSGSEGVSESRGSRIREDQGALTTPICHPMNTKEMKSFRRQLRSNGTPAEGGLWKLLKAKQINGLQFRRQFSVGKHILDFYCPALKLAIELDGDYHYYGATPERDIERDEELLYSFGIHTLRFENKIVFQQPQAIINSILEFQARANGSNESMSTPPGL